MADRSDNTMVYLVGAGQSVLAASGIVYTADDNGNLSVPFNDSGSIQAGPLLWEVVASGVADDLLLISGVPDVPIKQGYVTNVDGNMCFWMGVSDLLPSGWIDQGGVDAIEDLG
jgi:hypothetical protein